MAVDTESAWCYRNTQEDFVKYFDRLRSIGMSFNEIEKKLPELEKYYQEMVLDLIGDFDFKQSIYDLFRNWRAHR